MTALSEAKQADAAKEGGDDACTSCKDGTYSPGSHITNFLHELPCSWFSTDDGVGFSVLQEESCGNFECLWDDEDGKGCGPRFVSLFGHKIDLLEVKERSKQKATDSAQQEL